jgi:hypothetical protein
VTATCAYHGRLRLRVLVERRTRTGLNAEAVGFRLLSSERRMTQEFCEAPPRGLAPAGGLAGEKRLQV